MDIEIKDLITKFEGEQNEKIVKEIADEIHEKDLSEDEEESDKKLEPNSVSELYCYTWLNQ